MYQECISKFTCTSSCTYYTLYLQMHNGEPERSHFDSRYELIHLKPIVCENVISFDESAYLPRLWKIMQRLLSKEFLCKLDRLLLDVLKSSALPPESMRFPSSFSRAQNEFPSTAEMDFLSCYESISDFPYRRYSEPLSANVLSLLYDLIRFIPLDQLQHIGLDPSGPTLPLPARPESKSFLSLSEFALDRFKTAEQYFIQLIQDKQDPFRSTHHTVVSQLQYLKFLCFLCAHQLQVHCTCMHRILHCSTLTWACTMYCVSFMYIM